MNNNNRYKRIFPLKAVVVFVVMLILLSAISFILFGLYPVRREVKNISGYIESKPLNNDSNLSPELRSLIDEIRTKEHYAAFLNTTLKHSKGDSIALFIDLRDSLAILSFKGVSLFESKISGIKINSGLKKLPHFFRDSLYSGPMEVSEEISSIEKFPIVVKKAPKDTIEANQASAPVLPVQYDVFLAFSFDNNMVIQIDQQEEDLIGTKQDFRKYRRQYSRWFRNKNLDALKSSSERGYIYHLAIELPREDARSIYRALPLKPAVVIRY
ncbi:MAG: hypothetical protein CVU10_05260 [Bacteroidetes bacterium HGW-Bacteroidetes-5]|jgi:hypothetical protein|nr:MAG: hypothetical protein CVU10_05260 [Bacteroidetes bacterium HGW-Bacteroidetes-5]